MERIRFDGVGKSFRLRNRSDSLRDTIPNLLLSMVGKKPARQERFDAVSDVSFSVSDGEVVGLIGSNGAGKSTSLRLAAGIYEPGEGTVTVNGRVSALIELSAGFHPDLSGRENIFLAGALLGLRRRDVEAVFDRIVEFADIGKFIDSPVRVYSSGMAVRLGFAVAAHVPADILLVDEVLAVGDIDFQSRCLNRMIERCREGVAVLFVSHNLRIVEQFCQRVILLEKGRKVDEGPPKRIIDEYYRRTGRLMREKAALRAGVEKGIRRGLRITGVTVQSDADLPPFQLEVGGAVEIAMQWEAEESVTSPVFGVSIRTANGLGVSELRTGRRGDPSVTLQGRGTAVLRMEQVPLAPGGYSLSTFVKDETGMVDLDRPGDLYPFEVIGERADGQYGMVSFPFSWRMEESPGS